jgi:hypothetical protein
MPTVEGIFRIIDRASGPMQRMERQARQTDRAIERLGMTTDMVGNQRQQRQLNDLDRGYRTFGRTVDDTGGRVRRASRDLESHERRWRGLRAAVTEAGAAIRGAGAIFGVLKFPVMAAGVGVLVQAVGALGGGIIGLTPRVADLSGAFAALGPTMAGLGLAMVTTNLAFNDFGKALGGNKNAIRALTPEARRFLTTLHEYRGVMKELRQSAQGGLFGGLDTALRRIQRGVPTANTLLSGMSRTLGGLATNAANRFTTGGFLQDILGIGQAGTRGVARGGQAIINIIDAMRQLTTAAIPFTDWVTRTVERIGAFIDRWAIFERDSGRFASFLGRSRQSLQLFARIVGNLLGFVSALGRAARPLGDLLWRDVERGTRAWSRYANSVRGQVRLTEDFVAMYPAIHEIVTLFDNLVRAVFQMGTSQQLPGIARTLDEMVPTLQHLLDMFVQAFGPPTLDLLTQFAQTLDFLVGATGPITIMLTLLARILGLVNALVGAVPGLGRVLATAFSVIAIGLFINRLRGVAAGWLNVAGAANVAAAAETRALAMGGAAGLAGGAAVAGEAVTAGGVILPAGVAAGGLGAASMMGRGSRLARLGRLGTVAGRLGTAAGRFALPVTGALGAYGALAAPTSGSFASRAYQRFEGGINAATGGLYGRAHPARRWPVARAGVHDADADRAARRGLQHGDAEHAAWSARRHRSQHLRAGRGAGAHPDLLHARLRPDGRAGLPGGGGGPAAAAFGAHGGQGAAGSGAGGELARSRLPDAPAGGQGVGRVRRQVRPGGGDEARQPGRAAGDGDAPGAGPSHPRAAVFVVAPGGVAAQPEARRDVLAVAARHYARVPQARHEHRLRQRPDRVGHRDPVEADRSGDAQPGGAREGGGVEGVHAGAAEGGCDADPDGRLPGGRGEHGAGDGARLRPVGGALPSALSAAGRSARTRLTRTRSAAVTSPAGTRCRVMRRATRAGRHGPEREARHSGVAGNGRRRALRPGIAGVAGAVTGMFPGLSMTSGVRPGDTGSYHSIGEAVDLAGPPSLMSRAAAWIRGNLGWLAAGGHPQHGVVDQERARGAAELLGRLDVGGAREPHPPRGGRRRRRVRRRRARRPRDGAGGVGRQADGEPARGRGARACAGVPGTLADQVGLLFAAGCGAEPEPADGDGRGRERDRARAREGTAAWRTR